MNDLKRKTAISILILVSIGSMCLMTTLVHSDSFVLSTKNGRGWIFEDEREGSTIVWELETDGGGMDVYVTTLYEWENKFYVDRRLYYSAKGVVQQDRSFVVPHSDSWVLGLYNPNSFDVVVTYGNVHVKPPQVETPDIMTKTVYKTITKISTTTEIDIQKEIEKTSETITITEKETITKDPEVSFVPGFFAPTTILGIATLTLLGYRRKK